MENLNAENDHGDALEIYLRDLLTYRLRDLST